MNRRADKRDEAAAEQDQQAAQQAPPPADGGDDDIGKLQELAKLHDQGVLTDEEFTAAKAKVVS